MSGKARMAGCERSAYGRCRSRGDVAGRRLAQAAVVYCKTVGVPKGCVARPTAAAVVTTPAAAAVVATPGVGAPGVGVRAGTPMNRGGPVNRVGVR